MDALVNFADNLTSDELDNLKYRLSALGVRELNNRFELSADPTKKERFFTHLECIWKIQHYRSRVPEFGIAYVGRPDFLTDGLLEELRAESNQNRRLARLNYDQLITRVENADDSSRCEKLAASDMLHRFVTKHAGACERSYVTSYIYYDQADHCSRPHVDNMFTGLTAMINLRNEHAPEIGKRSSNICYWPDREPQLTILEPGDLMIFFGASAIHGRLPNQEGETVYSLLMSFRPI